MYGYASDSEARLETDLTITSNPLNIDKELKQLSLSSSDKGNLSSSISVNTNKNEENKSSDILKTSSLENNINNLPKSVTNPINTNLNNSDFSSNSTNLNDKDSSKSDRKIVDIINDKISQTSESISQNVSQTVEIVKNSLQKGVSSWYGKQFHGKKTASGEKFNMFSYTAAHRTLPLGTYVKVTNPKNNKTAIVKINDRGPFARSRILDLSFVAAKDLDIISHGHAPVSIEVVKQVTKNDIAKTQ
jgi:rare lipoprotein A